MDLFVAFLTGLTTGGLSCLAVQGGLLASSLAHQIEQDVQAQQRKQIALPILLFLLAKLAAYTLLGALLGALGALLQLTPTMRAVLQFTIAIFMIGNALRMFNVHPIFRYFAFEPPSFVTRYLRRRARKGTEAFTPLFLGALTVLIPCGVTQAVMAAALGTGSAVEGAATLFAFTLGASPVFFAIAYFATRLGERLEKHFMRFVAVVLLVLGFVAFDTGLNLVGSPVSVSSWINSVAASSIQSTQAVIQPAQDTQSAGNQERSVITLQAKNDGYFPAILKAPSERVVRLDVVTRNTTSCARAFVIPALKAQKTLPVTGTVSFDIPPQAKGSILRFTCSMGMYTGQIVFE
ncbi:MAG TPA: sulfite exporter TauE/SafE family protein [Anaerolineaceae bacterium]